MSLWELIPQARTFRRFQENEAVSKETLRDLVELARLSPSGGNAQPLKFILSWTPEDNAKIFPHTIWAGAMPDWKGPEEGERPAAYIVILGDTEIKKYVGVDHGIAALSIKLGAWERGLGSCILGALNRKELQKDLHLDDRYEILLVIALGKPAEEVVIEPVKDGNVNYWRCEKNIHHVPKRALDDIILEL